MNFVVVLLLLGFVDKTALRQYLFKYVINTPAIFHTGGEFYFHLFIDITSIVGIFVNLQ